MSRTAPPAPSKPRQGLAPRLRLMGLILLIIGPLLVSAGPWFVSLDQLGATPRAGAVQRVGAPSQPSPAQQAQFSNAMPAVLGGMGLVYGLFFGAVLSVSIVMSARRRSEHDRSVERAATVEEQQ